MEYKPVVFGGWGGVQWAVTGDGMTEITFTARDGKKLICSLWDNVTRPIGVVQIIHGMDEHVGRYERTQCRRYIQNRYA